MIPTTAPRAKLLPLRPRLAPAIRLARGASRPPTALPLRLPTTPGGGTVPAAKTVYKASASYDGYTQKTLEKLAYARQKQNQSETADWTAINSIGLHISVKNTDVGSGNIFEDSASRRTLDATQQNAIITFRAFPSTGYVFDLSKVTVTADGKAVTPVLSSTDKNVFTVTVPKTTSLVAVRGQYCFVAAAK